MVYIETSLNQKFVDDMKVIKEVLEPAVLSLDDKDIEAFPLAMFFATFVSEILKDIDDKDLKEIVIRKMLD